MRGIIEFFQNIPKKRVTAHRSLHLFTIRWPRRVRAVNLTRTIGCTFRHAGDRRLNHK
ncbi:hypothetical protein J2X61_000059 [Bacillus sp. 3255]|nr:hypothetical protein [Bacillus sp. 3255]